MALSIEDEQKRDIGIPKGDWHKFDQDGKLLKKYQPMTRKAASKNEGAAEAAEKALSEHIANEAKRSTRKGRRKQEPIVSETSIKTTASYFDDICRKLDRLIVLLEAK
jgi:hypothetical protein